MSVTEPLDLVTLRVVIAVAESGSISAGSERLHLAVAAASARISALEAALGVRIFERSPRGVELTSAGRMLVQRGRELLGDADQLASDLRDWGLGLAGHVRMLANASALLEVLPARLEAFMRSAPAHPRRRRGAHESRDRQSRCWKAAPTSAWWTRATPSRGPRASCRSSATSWPWWCRRGHPLADAGGGAAAAVRRRELRRAGRRRPR